MRGAGEWEARAPGHNCTGLRGQAGSKRDQRPLWEVGGTRLPGRRWLGLQVGTGGGTDGVGETKVRPPRSPRGGREEPAEAAASSVRHSSSRKCVCRQHALSLTHRARTRRSQKADGSSLFHQNHTGQETPHGGHHQADAIITHVSKDEGVTPNVCPHCLPGTECRADTWHWDHRDLTQAPADSTRLGGAPRP